MEFRGIARASALGFVIAGPCLGQALPNYAIFEIVPPYGYSETVAYGLSTGTTVVGDAIDGAARSPIFYANGTMITHFVDNISLSAIEVHRATTGQDLTTNQAVFIPWVGGVQQIATGVVSSFGVALNDRGHTVGVANFAIPHSFDTIPTVFRFDPNTNATTYPLPYARPGAISLPDNVACIVDHPGSADDGNLVILDANDNVIRPTIPFNLTHEMPSGFASNVFRICGTAVYKPVGGLSTLNQAFLFDEFGNFSTLPDPKGLHFPTDANAIDFWGNLVVGKTEVGASTQYATAWEVDPTNPFTPEVPTDLNTLIPANSNWYLDEATGVNSLHAICGWGHRTINGKYVRRGFLMVPINLDNLYCDPNTIVAGAFTTGTVALTLENSVPTLISLQSNSTAISMPSYIQVPAFKTSAQFLIQANAVVAPTTVTITAKYANLVKKVFVTVLPASPLKLVFQHLTVKGGQTAIGAFVFNGPVAAPQSVSLTSSDPKLVVPATATVPANSFDGYFVAQTKPVTKNETAMVTGDYRGKKYVASITITP